MANRHLTRISRRLVDMENTIHSLATAPQLSSSSFNDAAIAQTDLVPSGFVDEFGEPILEERTVARFGQQPDGSNTTVSLVGPTPPQPTAPLVSSGPGTLVVEWSGEFVDRIEPYMDHDFTAIHVSTTPAFTPNAATLMATIRATQGETVSVPVTGGASYYVSLVAVSKAGVWSLPAPYSTGAAGAAGGADPVWVAAIESRLDDVEGVAAGAAVAAATSYSLADGKTTVWYTTPPPEADDGDMWVDGANGNRVLHKVAGVWTTLPFDTEAIAPAAITAPLLAGEIVLGSTVIAGSPSGAHVELDGSGLTAYGLNPDGDLALTTRMGTGDTDAFAVYDPISQTVIGALDSEGAITATRADLGALPGDVSINGVPFETHLDPFPRGAIAYGKRTDTQATTVIGGAGLKEYLEVQVFLRAGRTYTVRTNEIYFNSSTANAKGVLFLFQAVGGAPVTLSSTQLASSRVQLPTANSAASSPGVSSLVAIPQWGASQEYRFLLAFSSDVGNTALTTSASFPVTLTVTDVGPYIYETGIDRTGSANGGTTPGTGERKNYVAHFVATHTSSYDGSGNLRTGTTDMIQGYNSSNGNQQAISGFTGGAASSNYPSEVGKTLSQVLTGATVTRIEASLYFNHWYYNAGGTALLGVSNSAAPFPSTVSAFSYTTVSANWPKPGRRTVVLPTISNPRSVFIGRPPTNAATYYGRANGAGASSNKPVLSVYYTR